MSDGNGFCKNESCMFLVRRLIAQVNCNGMFTEDVGFISYDDFEDASNSGIKEINEMYGDNYNGIAATPKSLEWHFGRILYFVNHICEIKNIRIGLREGCNTHAPGVIDGNHRLFAAMYLYKHEQMSTVKCIYSGYEDTRDYLLGVGTQFYGMKV